MLGLLGLAWLLGLDRVSYPPWRSQVRDSVESTGTAAGVRASAALSVDTGGNPDPGHILRNASSGAESALAAWHGPWKRGKARKGSRPKTASGARSNVAPRRCSHERPRQIAPPAERPGGRRQHPCREIDEDDHAAPHSSSSSQQRKRRKGHRRAPSQTQHAPGASATRRRRRRRTPSRGTRSLAPSPSPPSRQPLQLDSFETPSPCTPSCLPQGP